MIKKLLYATSITIILSGVYFLYNPQKKTLPKPPPKIKIPKKIKIVGFGKKYYGIKDTKMMKKEFANILLPLIQKQNMINGYSNRIPPSLALAQAAIESGWGKSYFVKKANNIYGQWTYKGRGIIPRGREEGKKHKIKIFDSLQDSVRGYMHNLNTHNAYKDFRAMREKMGDNFDGINAANTMISYSGIGQKYIDMLQNMIAREQWYKYDFESIK